MTREDCLNLGGIIGFVVGWGLAKLDKLFDYWEERVRSRRRT